MQRKIVEYLNALGCGYVILICAVLPLYMRNGFIMIGDAKYTFFLIAAPSFFSLVPSRGCIAFCDAWEKQESQLVCSGCVCSVVCGICDSVLFGKALTERLRCLDMLTGIWD